MKKIISCILSLALLFGCFAGMTFPVSAASQAANKLNATKSVVSASYVTAPVAGKAYKMALDKKDGKLLYFNGMTESASVTYRLQTTTDVNEAVDVYLEDAGSGNVWLYFMNNGIKTYIRVFHRIDGEPGYGKGSLEFVTAKPSNTFYFDTVANTLIYNYDGNNAYYMGTYGSYTTFSVSNTSYITGNKASNVDVSQFPARFYEVSGSTEPPATEPGTEPTTPSEPTPVPDVMPVFEPDVGVGYKFGFYQNMLVGKPFLAFSGGMAGYYLATAKAVNEMVDIYVEAADNGYCIYFQDNGIKTYIDLIVRENDNTKVDLKLRSSGTHTVWQLNTQYKYVYTSLAGSNWYLGTFNANSSISASKIAYISDPTTIGVSQFCAWFNIVTSETDEENPDITEPEITEPEITEPEFTEPEFTEPPTETVPEGFEYIITDGEVSITGYTGSANELVIPATINGYPVISIKTEAFAGCSNLTSVIIPDSVTSIGVYAFYNCSSLTGIWVGENNSYYSSDEFGALYNKDKTTLIAVPAGIQGNFPILDSVYRVREGAFSSCKKLESITIPIELVIEKYGSYFIGCENLNTVFYEGTREQRGEAEIYIAQSDYPGGVDQVVENWHYGVQNAVFAEQACYHCAECDNYFLGSGDYALAEIVFKGWDGTVVSVQHLKYNDAVTVPADPAAGTSGYEFVGWDQEVTYCNGNAVYNAVFQKIYALGDINSDQKINSLDGLMLLRYLNGWNVNIPSPNAMDVNGDGKVNSLDGLILMRYLNGWNVTIG